MLAEQEWLVHGEVTDAPASPASGSRPSGPAGCARSAPSSRSSPTARVVVELPVRLRRLARPRGPQGRRRPGRARARRRPRGRAQGGHRQGRASDGGAAAEAPGHPASSVVAPNPGPMTLDGHQHLRRRQRDPAWVIDPGPDDAGPPRPRPGRRAGRAAGSAASCSPTRHGDHSRAKRRRARLGRAELAAGRRRRAAARTAIADPGPRPRPRLLRAAATVCFCGDLILGEGSTIVPPRRRRLARRLHGLAAHGSQALELELLCPGHGPWIDRPGGQDRRVRRAPARARARSGRRPRGRRALARRGCSTRPGPTCPADAPGRGLAMQAHLEKLEAEGAAATRAS